MTPIALHLLAVSNGAAVNCPDGGTCYTGLPKIAAGSSELHTVLTIVFGIAAAISVLMIVVGGLLFVTSGGNPQNVTRARETVLYSVIGLLVSLLAETIVAFALGKL
jgi:hypothetical protein